MCYFDLFTPWPSSFDLPWSMGRVKKGFKDYNPERVDTSLCCLLLSLLSPDSNQRMRRSILSRLSISRKSVSPWLPQAMPTSFSLTLSPYLSLSHTHIHTLSHPTSLSHTHIHTRLSLSLHITQTFLSRYFCLAQNNSVKPKPKSH